MTKKFIINGVTWDCEELFYELLADSRLYKWTKYRLEEPATFPRECHVCGRPIPDDDLSEYYVVRGSINTVHRLDGTEFKVCPAIYCDVDCFEDYIRGHGPN